jgi:hypothetical protein
MHSEREAAQVLLAIIEPAGLTLKDVERIGCPENISEDISEDDAKPEQAADNVAAVDANTFNLNLLADTALEQKIAELPALLQKHKANARRHHFGNSYMYVERCAQHWTIRMPADLEFFVRGSPKFNTSYQAHLHIKENLEP